MRRTKRLNKFLCCHPITFGWAALTIDPLAGHLARHQTLTDLTLFALHCSGGIPSPGNPGNLTAHWMLPTVCMTRWSGNPSS